AHYTGGTSSNPDYSYAGATSPSQTLTVTAGASTTTKLSLNHAIRVQGAEESETLTVTVAGKAGDGYPKGTVTIETTTGVTVCSTGERRGGADDSSKFTCSLRASTLVARAYELTATYTPTATRPSSTANVTYARSTSSRVKFTVTTAVATKSTLGQRSAAERYGSETQEHFTVEVTGKSGDGYPRGTVEVRTTGGTALCTSTAPTSHGSDTATFACSPGAESLGAGTYTIVGAYEPDSTHSSSSTSIAYAQSTSSSATFKVTAPGATRLYGATQDATAAAELESVYPGARGDCPGTASVRPVVLATDQHYPDALAASYLERWLGTGMLLTPATSASDATLSALRVEGITEVYVVGGPLAIATSVVSELEDTYAYECGGTTRTAAHLGVFRVYGQTQYTTAEEVAETPGPGYPRSLDLRGAYGRYDDTTGGGTAAPPTGARRTAILASGAEFQDAEAAATLAYADHLPLLLTTPTTLSPQALGAINDLGVTQVILMGGPLAVSDAVVSELASHQVSVLRVAGKDYTDTAEQLAEMELGTTKGYEGLGWAPTRGVTVARGDFYPDGLAGAVVAAHGGSTGGGAEPMLLTENPTEVGADLTVFLEEAGSKGIDGDGARVTSLTVLGGPLALTTSVVDSMVAELSS
ncbi:MAG: cell wall-binding repeat-containing protein, partial [Acidimicrobiales bacterium]